MKPTQERKGWYWKTDDAAELWLTCFPADGPEPEQLRVRLIGHYGLVRATDNITVPLAGLRFMGAGLFGEGRPSGSGSGSKWTGDCYKFAVYLDTGEQRGRGRVVIIRTDGSGTVGYMDDSLTAVETWTYLCQTCKPETLWNVVSAVVFAHETGREQARHEAYKLFVEGRLKKQKRSGSVRVIVTDKKAVA